MTATDRKAPAAARKSASRTAPAEAPSARVFPDWVPAWLDRYVAIGNFLYRVALAAILVAGFFLIAFANHWLMRLVAGPGTR